MTNPGSIFRYLFTIFREGFIVFSAAAFSPTPTSDGRPFSSARKRLVLGGKEDRGAIVSAVKTDSKRRQADPPKISRGTRTLVSSLLRGHSRKLALKYVPSRRTGEIVSPEEAKTE